jgi:hypothetical protein
MKDDESNLRGRPILQDASAASAYPNLPAFLARPDGAPVYHGFPIVPETLTDGWRFGAITAFEDPDGCTHGDGYVVAHDGSRAGIVWEVGDLSMSEIQSPDEGRWGVYAVWFPKPVRRIDDLIDCFRSVLPDLQAAYERVRGGMGTASP